MKNSEEKISYTFRQILFCNMCGSPVENHFKLGQRLNQSSGLRARSARGISVSVLRCNVCDLIYANPQPIPNDADDHDFIDAWSEDYFQYSDEYFSDELAKVKRLLNFRDGMKALDVGAGIGKGMRALESAGFDAYGVEPSANACRFAYEKNGVLPEKLHCETVENSEFPDNFFDFVSFGAVLEHVYDPSESLRKAFKAMKPGGILFAEVPNSRYFVTKLMNIYHKINLTGYTSHISPMHAPFHHFEFGVESFEKFCEANGCEIANVEILVCKTPFLPHFLVPFVNKYMVMTETGMQISVFLRKSK